MFTKPIKFILLLVFILTLQFGVSLVSAQVHVDRALGGLDITAGQANVSKVGQDDPTTGLTTFIGTAINYIFGVVVVIFLTIILIGGFFWMTARGSEEKIDKAKTFILNGFFGLMIIFLSYALVSIILFALNRATNNVTSS